MKIDVRAKINWTLQIVGRRDDGYHLLDSVMQRIDLCDTIEICQAEGLSFRLVGADASVPEDRSNLVLRAAEALCTEAGRTYAAGITLTKRIPSGAGLGGGSADAAAALTALNDFWGLGYTCRKLADIGCRLGADIPYCLQTEPMRVSGIGEIIQPLPCSVPSLPLVLLKGTGSLSTKEIYRCFDAGVCPQTEKKYADEWLSWIKNPLKTNRSAWNDLETASLTIDPGIARAKDDLYACGACFAQMTGSGSAVYGVFSDEAAALRCREKLRPLYPTCIVCRTV